MDWINRFNSAINYMEEHMKGDIDMEKVGRIAGCSAYHFQRIFTYMSDVTLSEYIRRRKMSLAAVDLLAGEKVIDVALAYGYDSPTAFNRAFKNIHGVSTPLEKEMDKNSERIPQFWGKANAEGIQLVSCNHMCQATAYL